MICCVVRCAKFVARRNCILIGTDDNHVRVYNYNTLERLADFEAHSDYIRSIAIHPTKPLFLTTSDDCTVKLWDWEAQYKLVMTFEGHQHYVMQVVFNPKDPNTFATASLDRTVKIWSLGNAHCNYTLDGGHEKGVNAVAFYHGGDRPFLASASDDQTVRIWDYQSKASVRTLTGHTQNVSSLCFHPRLPYLLSAGEDGAVRVWGTSTFRCELVINAGLDRLWSVACSEQQGEVGLAGDLGSSVMLLGKQDAPVSMDSVNGKLVWAHQSTISQCRLQDLTGECRLEKGKGVGRELGQSDFSATAIQFSPNGRFICVQGDGEYCVYTAVAWRNRAFGKSLDFVWAAASVGNNVFAVRDSPTCIRVFEDFQETLTIKTDVQVDRIYGQGTVLAATGSGYCLLYDYRTGDLLQAIEQDIQAVSFSEPVNGGGWSAALIANPRGLYIVSCGDQELNVHFKDEQERVRGGGVWIDSRAFVFASADSGKISYWLSASGSAAHGNTQMAMGNETQLLAVTDAVSMMPLGYYEDKLYFMSADMTVRSVTLPLELIAYQTAILSGEYDHADTILSNLLLSNQKDSDDTVNKLAKFLDAAGLTDKAVDIATDPQLLFAYNLRLGRLNKCREHLLAMDGNNTKRWRQLGEAAIKTTQTIPMAAESLVKAGSRADGLLVSAVINDTAQLNVLQSAPGTCGFAAAYLLRRFDDCFGMLMAAGRFVEAALFAQSHQLSGDRVSEAVACWRGVLGNGGGEHRQTVSALLADPLTRPDLFPTTVISVGTRNQQPQKRKGSIKSTTSYDDDLLSVEVNTTGTGSMRTDDVDEAMAIAAVGSLPTIHDDRYFDDLTISDGMDGIDGIDDHGIDHGMEGVDDIDYNEPTTGNLDYTEPITAEPVIAEPNTNNPITNNKDIIDFDTTCNTDTLNTEKMHTLSLDDPLAPTNNESMKDALSSELDDLDDGWN